MERLITHELDRKRDGARIVRNYFINDENVNHLKDAQSHFTKEEKKAAKLSHKRNLKV